MSLCNATEKNSSQIDTANPIDFVKVYQFIVAKDTAKKNTTETYFLIPKTVLDRANADAEMCDFLKDQYPNLIYLRTKYKDWFRIYVKIDTAQQVIIEKSNQIIKLTEGSYRDLKKRVVKIRILKILNQIKEPLIGAGGFLLGYLIAKNR